mmetsp:Transcript_85131/g.264489  ORF Transcript_85131/g.264489 Transcript_85131/m.264489 type:complete len:716 (-) Transcript_85131:608-2755(-)
MTGRELVSVCSTDSSALCSSGDAAAGERSSIPDQQLLVRADLLSTVQQMQQALHHEHQVLQDWMRNELEKHNDLLVEQKSAIQALLERDQESPRLGTPRCSASPHSSRRTRTFHSSRKIPEDPEPVRSRSTHKTSVVENSDAPLPGGIEEFRPIVPPTPPTQPPGFELGLLSPSLSSVKPHNRGARKVSLIGVPTPPEPTSDPTLLEGVDTDVPVPLPVRSSTNLADAVFVSSTMSDGSEEGDPDQSDQDREEWKKHLQRRVTQQLGKKQFRRRSVSSISAASASHSSESGEPKKKRCLALTLLVTGLVESNAFHWISAGVILINVAFLGYTTDVSMDNVLTSPFVADPGGFKVMDKVFMGWYIWELAMRLAAYRFGFVQGPDAKWNLFDTALVVLNVAEEAIQDLHMGAGSLRVMRGIRMFRVLRVIRVMRYFRDLRLMVCSILQSLGSLSWALILLLIIMYLFSIIFMQGAILYLQDANEAGVGPDAVVKDGVILFYSSLVDTMYTLLASIVNGIGWVDAVKPLESISIVYRWLFTFYIVFVVIGVLNVLTGIFVERACELSGLDKDLVIQTQMKRNETFLAEMKRIFEEADADGSGTISWEEFKGYLENDRVKAYLSTQQLDAFDARTLFDILNDGRGTEMSIESFIVGCQRLKGMARSVDLVAVLQETRAANRKLKSVLRRLDGSSSVRQGSLEFNRSMSFASSAQNDWAH